MGEITHGNKFSVLSYISILSAGSDSLWLGPDKRFAIGIQLPDGSLQGHYVEVVVGEVLAYRSLGVVEQAVALKVMTLMQQAG